ncbi:MAG: ribbon-helix-helix domain-containing protein [Thermofilum sp.]|nr:ribbon-helix-helix domain-containing protein [Thermofilum sp.]
MGPGRRYTTVSIPESLFRRIEKLIKGSGFRSVSEFVTFVLRQVVADMEAEKLKGEGLTEEERKAIIERLKRLGYL